MTRVYLEPRFGHEDDKGDGGIRRVVEAQHRHLPTMGVEFVDQLADAEVVACHIAPMETTKRWLEAHPHVPYVLHCHGAYWAEYTWLDWHKKANADVMESVRQADVVTAPSEWVAQALRRASLRRVEVLQHGVDLNEWPLQDGSKGYVLWNKTRVDPVCDPAPLLSLTRDVTDVPFVTTYWPSKRAAPKHVTVTGAVGYEKAKQLVQEAAVYLCTTRETFGIGTLEAMASGVPILGWKWGGQAEFVEHEKTGWLCTPGEMNKLSEGLRYCLAHRQQMALAGRQLVEDQYQWQDRMAPYARLYDELREKAELKRPKVSIVVPAYGLEEHLPDALQSVADQTFQDWECVVVDDSSPDRCGEIAEEFARKDTRFRVIHNETNQYLAGSLNIGVDHTIGDYIVALDADNMIKSRALGILAAELDKDRSTAIAYGAVEFLDPDGKRWHSGWPMTFRADWQLMQRNMVPSTCMFRRSVWELTGGYRRRWKSAEDADFWTRATSYGFRARMVTQADTLVYRNRNESMSRVEEKPDWTLWYPWCKFEGALAPAAILREPGPQEPIPSCEPVLVSVVIPVGPGHEELLIDALDSVDGQTFRLWECIVVNDTGSPLRWLPSWAREVRVSTMEKGQVGHVGVAAARNAGIRLAKGKLFMPLDADDTFQPEAIAEMYKVYQEHGGYVYCDWFERWTDRENVWEAEEYEPRALLEKGCLHLVTALYPKSAWEDLGGFDEELAAWEDWDFQLKLANAGICGTRVPVPLLTYRKDTGRRREENYADFEESKAGILNKWSAFFERREELMACRGCRGGGARLTKPTPQPAAAGSQTPAVPPDGQFLLVEYIGRREGPMRFRAPSGQKYRFANLETDRVKLVRADDAAWFADQQDFRIREPEAPVKA